MAMIGCAMMGYAQRYETNRGRVYYGNEPVMHADARSFVDLGHGYAKDNNNVYMNGRVLENVDPTTFRLKGHSGRRNHERSDDVPMPHRGYYKTQMNVYYGDRRIDAMASSFVDLGGGYAKDNLDVYYCGKKVRGPMASSFVVLGGGYAKDNLDVYYCGEEIRGAMASSFVYEGNGYAKDACDAYYRGKKIR